MKKYLFKFEKIFFVFGLFFCTSLKGYNAELKLYLKNTGNETISVVYGYHEWKGLLLTSSGWESRYSGYYQIKPGERVFMFTIDNEYDQVTLAFVKRQGYIVYDFKANSSRDIGVPEIYVNPNNVFEYTDKPPTSYVPVERSCTIQFKTNGAEGTLYQTIEIPSYTTDKVISMTATPKKVVLSKNQNFEKLAEDLIFEQSKQWSFNRYQQGSTFNVRITARDSQDRAAEITASYGYLGIGGQSSGSVRITFNNGLPDCLYFFDFPNSCRTANRVVVAGFANGEYQKR